jgi:Tannase and feruloyl esterase
MKREFAAVIALAGLLPAGQQLLGAAGQTVRPPGGCAQLTSLRLPDVTISEAAAIPAATSGAVRAAHCRVTGVIGTEIGFSLLLPDDWNRKFFMGGGGGFVGSIQNSAQTTVNAGYATVGTDTGHQGGGTDASWAHNNLERQLNFGYLAVHRTAETAKAIAAHYYGSAPARSYFQGCSRGGGQALMEAQRFPADFDGIIAGAPAYDWTGLAAANIRNMQAVFPDPHRTTSLMFTPETLKTIEATIIESCDARDGVTDGLIDDPRQCHFDVNTLPISADQKRALRAIYEPTTNRDGEIYPGQPFGGEGQTAGWPQWITGVNASQPGQAPSLRFAFGTGIFKYLVFNDPNWDYSTYELANWKKDTALAASFLNASNPDLRSFNSRGGKLILWHGWADPALTPLASIRYQDDVLAHDPNARSYFRTFLLPGVLHCGGGAGPDTADWTTALVDWAENGTAPDRVIASKISNGTVTRSRPLCPYPQKAVYTGSGSIDDERNFVCK